MELSIKANPKTFWKYIKSRRSSASVRTCIFLGNSEAQISSEAANFLGEFFKFNYIDEELDLP